MRIVALEVVAVRARIRAKTLVVEAVKDVAQGYALLVVAEAVKDVVAVAAVV